MSDPFFWILDSASFGDKISSFPISGSYVNAKNRGITKVSSDKVIDDQQGCLTKSCAQRCIKLQIRVNLVLLTGTCRCSIVMTVTVTVMFGGIMICSYEHVKAGHFIVKGNDGIAVRHMRNFVCRVGSKEIRKDFDRWFLSTPSPKASQRKITLFRDKMGQGHAHQSMTDTTTGKEIDRRQIFQRIVWLGRWWCCDCGWWWCLNFEWGRRSKVWECTWNNPVIISCRWKRCPTMEWQGKIKAKSHE